MTRSPRQDASNPLFGLWAWLIVVVFVVPGMVLVILSPGRGRRRAVARGCARGLFWLTRVDLDISGLERLPESCIVAANHASYLDGIILTAALPPRFAFIIKREITQVPLVGWMLHRLGSEFVDRFDKGGARQDASRIIKRTNQGTCLGVFPEGTFVSEPGLRPFHLGGFMAATRAGLPVVPIVIRGARQILPAHMWLPRRGALRVEVLHPIAPQARNGGAARILRDAVRSEILERCGEPDHRHQGPVGS